MGVQIIMLTKKLNTNLIFTVLNPIVWVRRLGQLVKGTKKKKKKRKITAKDTIHKISAHWGSLSPPIFEGKKPIISGVAKT